MRSWQKLYQKGLTKANHALDLLKIGKARPQEIVVVDETHIGFFQTDEGESFTHKGISKGAPRIRSSTRNIAAVKARVAKRLPARTIWKKPAHNFAIRQVRKNMLKKRPASKAMKKPKGKDMRSNGRWLWAAVTVGHGKVRYTHGNGLKRIAWRLLPHPHMAEDGKPRGEKEIAKTFEAHIVKGSKIVFDGWLSSVAAAERLGFDHAKPVVHDVVPAFITHRLIVECM